MMVRVSGIKAGADLILLCALNLLSVNQILNVYECAVSFTPELSMYNTDVIPVWHQ